MSWQTEDSPPWQCSTLSVKTGTFHTRKDASDPIFWVIALTTLRKAQGSHRALYSHSGWEPKDSAATAPKKQRIFSSSFEVSRNLWDQTNNQWQSWKEDSGISKHLAWHCYHSAASWATFHPTFPYQKKIITTITNKNAINLTDILLKLNKPGHKIETGREEIKINKQPQTLVLKSNGVLEIMRSAGNVTYKIYTAIGKGYSYNICAYLNGKYVLVLMWMQR